jgi:hypothetical protein
MRPPRLARTSDGGSGAHVSTVGQRERATQDRVVALFATSWGDPDRNAKVEAGDLATGDPATDLSVVWMLLPRSAWRSEDAKLARRYGTHPGRAAACRIHVAICASSSRSSSRMSR